MSSNSEKHVTTLDKIAKNLTRNGVIKHLEIPISGGYIVQITQEKYLQLAKSGQNPITQITSITTSATATARSSSSLSQKFQNIIHDVEKSGVNPKKLSEVKTKLNTLESELNKPDPAEKVIKKVMRWASNFSLELFLKLAPIVAERLLKPV